MRLKTSTGIQGRTWFSNFGVHGVRQNSHLKRVKQATLEYSGVHQAITVWIVKIRLPRRRKKNDKIHVLSIHFTNDCIFTISIIIGTYQKISVKTVLCHLVLEQVTWLFCLHHLGRWSTPAYASKGVPAHLISVLPVRSGRRKDNS